MPPLSAHSLRLNVLNVRPLEHPSGSLVDFGAEVVGCNVAELTDDQFAALERAVLTYHVVVVRGQGKLRPQDQYELTRRFDPAAQLYGHGRDKKLMAQGVLTRDLNSLPDVPEVQLIGHGKVTDHEGIAELELHHPSHHTFHHTPLSAAAEERGATRFFRWHIDAALYDLHPPKVTTLLAVEVPRNRQQTVLFDDGTGDELSVSLGTTAFVSGAQAFRALSGAQKAFALRTQARYAPHPYVWMRSARALSNGLGLVSEGKELPRDALPPFQEDRIATLPLVWANPLTGEPALQVHPCCVEDLMVDGVPVGNLAESRRLLYDLMRPAIAPKRILAHVWRQGDLVIFNNRGVWHTVVGSMQAGDRRVYHQCNLASTEPPLAAA